MSIPNAGFAGEVTMTVGCPLVSEMHSLNLRGNLLCNSKDRCSKNVFA